MAAHGVEGTRVYVPHGVRVLAMLVGGATLGVIAVLAGTPLTAQACREPHYRWTKKVDTSGVAVPPQPTSVAAILATWAPPLLGSRDVCAPRRDRELRTSSLLAWVRRVDQHKDDGDWHLEVTDRGDSPADSCIVAEIPDPRYSSRYALARSALDSLIVAHRVGKGGMLRRPVRARVTGLAFFDGQHRRGGRRSERIDGGHGRCNASVQALWEIHPVYRIGSP